MTPAARIAASPGESSSRSVMSTGPAALWQYPRIGSFGAISNDGPACAGADISGTVTVRGRRRSGSRDRRFAADETGELCPTGAAGVAESPGALS